MKVMERGNAMRVGVEAVGEQMGRKCCGGGDGMVAGQLGPEGGGEVKGRRPHLPQGKSI